MVIFIFFSRDVPIDVPDKYGFTGLMQASQKGYTEYVDTIQPNNMIFLNLKHVLLASQKVFAHAVSFTLFLVDINQTSSSYSLPAIQQILMHLFCKSFWNIHAYISNSMCVYCLLIKITDIMFYHRRDLGAEER